MAMALCEPEIGCWYRDIENRLFEVVALEDDDSIEVQYFDGDVTEFDQESWELLCMNKVSEPCPELEMEGESFEEDDLLNIDSMKTISWDNVVGEADV